MQANQIPRTPTFGPVVRLDVAGAPLQRNPSFRRRSPSPAPSAVERPTLIRSQTPQPKADQQAAIARMFSENMFADPPVSKAWKIGPKLFTDSHQRLIYFLREECGRLFSFNHSLKEKISTLDRQMRDKDELINTLKNTNKNRADRLVEVTNELREAQEQLQAMDDALNFARSKRRSRIDDASLREAL